jgi:hypothetical protein
VEDQLGAGVEGGRAGGDQLVVQPGEQLAQGPLPRQQEGVRVPAPTTTAVRPTPVVDIGADYDPRGVRCRAARRLPVLLPVPLP